LIKIEKKKTGFGYDSVELFEYSYSRLVGSVESWKSDGILEVGGGEFENADDLLYRVKLEIEKKQGYRYLMQVVIARNI